MDDYSRGLELSGLDTHPVILMLQALWPLLTKVQNLGCELYNQHVDKESQVILVRSIDSIFLRHGIVTLF